MINFHQFFMLKLGCSNHFVILKKMHLLQRGKWIFIALKYAKKFLQKKFRSQITNLANQDPKSEI